MNNFLYYDTPINQLQVQYPQFQTLFDSGKETFTQLPKNIAVIRAVATVAFTCLAALKLSATVFCWPVVVAGMGFAGWTIYSHLLSKDPLMEAFYKITGGKEEFEKLPEINLTQASNEKLSEVIKKLDWDQLDHPIARTKTLDGRHVVIIKGLSRDNNGFFANCQTKSVLAFVEKVGPDDVYRIISNLPEIAQSIMHAVCLPHQGNTFGGLLHSSSIMSGNQRESRNSSIHSSISSDMANEFFTQLAKPEPIV